MEILPSDDVCIDAIYYDLYESNSSRRVQMLSGARLGGRPARSGWCRKYVEETAGDVRKK